MKIDGSSFTVKFLTTMTKTPFLKSGTSPMTLITQGQRTYLALQRGSKFLFQALCFLTIKVVVVKENKGDDHERFRCLGV